MKKYIAIILALMLLCITTGAYASGFSDVPANAVYADALNRVSSLGIVSGDGNGQFRPDGLLTRDQFAKLIVVTSGLQSMADTMKGATIFPDVVSNGWSSGYINAAVNKGFITGMPDGTFHPGDSVTFAQACTVMIRALGYTDQDIQGLWPRNYIGKAADLGLTTGINFGNGSGLPRWAAVMMLDKLLDTNIKKVNAADPDKTFAAAAGMTMDNIYSVYSKPEIVKNFDPASKKVGSIDLSGDPSVVRNTIDTTTTPQTNNTGESIKISQIKDHDVVYQVSDVWNKNRYILVVDNKVTGLITGILPNKYSPKTIQINNKDYELGKYFDLSKINSTDGAFKINDSVTISIGYDGKVVDIYYPDSTDNSNYAFVINYEKVYSTNLADYGSEKYNVKLLLGDGSTATYRVDSDPSGKKGKLVKYTKVYETPTASTDTTQPQKAALEDVSYVSVGDVVVNKYDKQINSSYVTDNVKIFNLISNDSGADAQVSLMDWSDMPAGTLQSGKVLFWNKLAPFDDINVLVMSDALEQQYKFASVEKVEQASGRGSSGYNLTMMIDGKDYVFNYIPGLNQGRPDYTAGQMLKVKLVNGRVSEIHEIANPETKGVAVQAIDSKRIKVNGTTYRFTDDVYIYFKYYDGTCKVKGISDVLTNTVYGQVEVYTDKPLVYGGKARVVVISVL